jgi:SAM-dependent methyltransferase
MVDHVSPRPGESVLELAAGPGDTGFMAARRIAPNGTLICSDASQGMLDVARERAAEQGVENVEFKQLQLEWIDLPTATVDVILCRWGFMLTIDPAAAMRESRRVLKPGGRLAAAVWDIPDANPWVIVLQRVIVELGHAEQPSTDGPGMFALSREGLLTEMLADAGFFDIVVEPVAIVRRYTGVLDWIGETRDLSRGFASVWGSLSDAGRRELRERVGEAAAPYTDADGSITLPGSSLAVAASA